MRNLIVLFILKISICEIIKIPLGIINPKNDYKNNSLIAKLFFSKPYVNLSIGTPPQLIPVLFKKDSFSIIIYQDNFNPNKSSTFNALGNVEEYFLDFYVTGYPSKDIINFGNYQGDKLFDFVLAVFYDNKYGCIGMKIARENKDELPSFSTILKNNKIISNNIWTIKMKNFQLQNIEDNNIQIGELILGEYPHNYETDKIKYNESIYKFEDVPVHNYKSYWDIKIKTIYMNLTDSKEKIIIVDKKENYEVNLIYENFYIRGTKVYYELIYENFFNKYNYIKNNICIEKKIPENYFWTYIECKYDEKQILFDIKKFPNIYFESIEYDKIFELTYKDLFALDKNDNKYFFLVLFPTNYEEKIWGLGIPFLRKYQFIFDEGKKLIGYYNSPENSNDDSNKGTNEKFKLYILIVALVLIIIFLIGLAFVLIKKLLYNKKRIKRAIELDDDGYEYNSKESLNNESYDSDVNNENKSDKNIIN